MANEAQGNIEVVGITFGGFDPSGEGVLANVYLRAQRPDGSYEQARLPTLLMSVEILREFHSLFPQLWQILEGRASVGESVPPLTEPLPAWDSGPGFSMTAAQAYCAEIALTRGFVERDAVELVLAIAPFLPPSATPTPGYYVLPTWAARTLEQSIGKLLERHRSTHPAKARPH